MVLYKVTPLMTPAEKEPAKDPSAPKEARKRRKSAVYDADGNEVLITMMCLKCRAMKPLTQFGLRKMADGAIRNQPWCRTCRSGATSKRKESTEQVESNTESNANSHPESAHAETAQAQSTDESHADSSAGHAETHAPTTE